MATAAMTRHVRDALHVRRAEAIFWPANRAGFAIAIPLLVVFLLGRIELLPAAVFGSMTSVYARNEAYPRRLRTLLSVGAVMVCAVFAGALVGVVSSPRWHEPLALLVLALIAGAASAWSLAVRLGPPGALIFSFAAGVYAHLPMTAATLPWHVLTVAASAAFACAVGISGRLFAPLAPQCRATANALDAVVATLRDPAARHRAESALHKARHSIGHVPSPHWDSPSHHGLAGALAEAEDALLRPAAHRPEALVSLAEDVRRGDVPLSESDAQELPARPPARWGVVRDLVVSTVRPDRVHVAWAVPCAARVALAAIVAGAVTNLLGLGHAYWAAVSAVAVLQVDHAAASTPRMIQRSVGTLVGVLLGVALLQAHPPHWLMAVIVVGFSWCAELVVMSNYAIGVLFVTPVALLMATFGTETGALQLTGERLGATLIGAVIAGLAARTLPNQRALTRLRHALDEVRTLSSVTPPPVRELRQAVVRLAEAHEVAAGEWRSSEVPTEELHAVTDRARQRLAEAAGPQWITGRS